MNKNQTFSIDSQTSKKIEYLAKKYHISKSSLIRILIWNFKQNLINEGENNHGLG
ncbi:MAG: hypothetical protein MUO82_09645 [Candidatus Thermoplasmatota archaeon]|nr:hypothetical protein [Candidatus Thermoplasmatota archaeon]